MGNILFIIVVVVVVIAVLIYRKMQTASAISQTKTDKQALVESALSDSKPTEHDQQAVKPELKTEQQVPPVATPPVTAKPKVAVEEEYPQVVPNLPEALAEAVNALSSEKDALTRHRWLSQITEATYKKRKDAQYRTACDYFSTLHINEFDKIKAPLKKSNGGKLPQVMTFQNYANLLLEDERFSDAINVCQKAIKFGLDDKTQSGFAGRIERIKARQNKQSKMS